MATGHTALLFTALVNLITEALYLTAAGAFRRRAGLPRYLSTLVTWPFPICQSNIRKLPDQLVSTPPASTCLAMSR